MSGFPRWARWKAFAVQRGFSSSASPRQDWRSSAQRFVQEYRRPGGWKAFTVQRLFPGTIYCATIAVQVMCAIHFIGTQMFEVRLTTGASMLPTLGMSGDYLLHFRLPFLAALRSMRCAIMPSTEGCAHSQGYVGGSRFSKYDQAQGTGLQQGDLVVAISPVDPHRSVCKRVLGLPGDTVCLDPRLPPIPTSAWRTAHHQPTPAEHDKTSASPSWTDLLDNSMDESTPRDTQTLSHNQAAQLYTRSKGQVQYITVPVGHVWLAGDNVANSTDSRHYGPVPLGMVRGKVIARVWPDWQWHTDSHF